MPATPAPATVPTETRTPPLPPSLVPATEPTPPRPHMNLDTTTPMVKPGQVSRFTTVDTQKYGPWLLNKLTGRWPAVSAMTFSSWILGWTAGNMFLFVKMDNAVGLFEVYRKTPELSNRVRAIFVFCENPKSEQQQEQALQIYRHAKTWGRSVGARQVEDLEVASDLALVRLRNNANAKAETKLVFEL